MISATKISRLLSAIVIGLLMSACGTYRYYIPTPQATVFKNQGELQVTGNLNGYGSDVKAAYAVSDKIGVTGSYYSGIDDYEAQEIEIGVGYHQFSENFGYFAHGGLAVGHNAKYSTADRTEKIFDGEILRPYAQFNLGFIGRNRTRIQGHVMGIMRLSYLDFKGNFAAGNSSFSSNYLLIEPGAMWGFGSRVIKLDIGITTPIRPFVSFENATPAARTFPFTGWVGMRIVINRTRE